MAQLPTVDMKETKRYRWRDVRTSSVIGMDSNAFYTYGEKNIALAPNLWIVAKYNKETMAQEWQMEVERIWYRGSATRVNSLNVVNGEVFLFAEYFDMRRRVRCLILLPFDREGNPQSVVEIDQVRGSLFGDGSSFNVVWSADQSSFAVVAIPSYQSFGESILNVTSYDTEELLPRWSNELNLSNRPKIFLSQDLQVANNGDVYLLGTYRKWFQGIDFDNKPDALGHSLFKVDADGAEEAALGMTDYYINNMGVDVDYANGRVLVAGTYTMRNTSLVESTKGVFSVNVNSEDMSVLDVNRYPFAESFREDVAKVGYRSRREEVRAQFGLDFILRRPDGGSYMITEEYHRYEHVTENNGNRQVVIIHEFEGILVSAFDASGELEWVELVPKFQTTKGSTVFLSYTPVVGHDGLTIYMNDDRRNAKRYGKKRPRIFQNVLRSNHVMVHLTEDATTYHVMWSNNKTKRAPAPQQSISDERYPGEAVLLNLYRRKVQLTALAEEKE